MRLQVLKDGHPGLLLTEIMAFLPIWSCCFGSVKHHASNAEVEQHFSIIKGDKKRGKGTPRLSFVIAGTKRYSSI